MNSFALICCEKYLGYAVCCEAAAVPRQMYADGKLGCALQLVFSSSKRRGLGKPKAQPHSRTKICGGAEPRLTTEGKAKPISHHEKRLDKFLGELIWMSKVLRLGRETISI